MKMNDMEQHTKPAAQRHPGAEWPQFPDDLSCWTGTSMLVHLVTQQAGPAESLLPARPFHIPGRGRFDHRSLVSLLTYCYATGLYDSEEIQFRLGSDSSLRFFCGRAIPDSITLGQFRRRYQSILAETLGQVLRAAWERQAGGAVAGISGHPSVPWSKLISGSGFRREAGERLSRAVKADCAALDG
jgi:hypothetical protein